MVQDELNAIKCKWELKGIYQKGRDQQRKAVELTLNTFHLGFAADSYQGNNMPGGVQFGYASIADGRVVETQFWPALGNVSRSSNYSLNWDYANSLQKGEFVRDFPLPVYYRGTGIIDDESIKVILLGQ
jgi:hypothetical protein